jgi:hypothetical protein
MKSLILTVTVLTALFIIPHTHINAAPMQQNGQVDAWEYIALKDGCRYIVQRIIESFVRAGGAQGGGVLTCSALQHAFKPEISNYLLSHGTPAARKIYAEYEAVGWKYPDILEI